MNIPTHRCATAVRRACEAGGVTSPLDHAWTLATLLQRHYQIEAATLCGAAWFRVGPDESGLIESGVRDDQGQLSPELVFPSDLIGVFHSILAYEDPLSGDLILVDASRYLLGDLARGRGIAFNPDPGFHWGGLPSAADPDTSHPGDWGFVPDTALTRLARCRRRHEQNPMLVALAELAFDGGDLTGVRALAA